MIKKSKKNPKHKNINTREEIEACIEVGTEIVTRINTEMWV